MLATLVAGPLDVAADVAKPSVDVPVQTLEAISCSRQGDNIVCVFPALRSELAAKPAPNFNPLITTTRRRPPAYRPTPHEAELQAPEVFTELRAADADIERAQDLFRRASEDAHAVLAQQMLHHAQERRRIALTMLLERKPVVEDPFEDDQPKPATVAPALSAEDAAWLLVCDTEDAADECDEGVHGMW
jgi:hypothetical protein